MEKKNAEIAAGILSEIQKADRQISHIDYLLSDNRKIPSDTFGYNSSIFIPEELVPEILKMIKEYQEKVKRLLEEKLKNL